MNGVGRLIFTLWLGAAFGQVLALLTLFNNLEDARSDAIGRTLQIMVTRVAQAASASAALGLPLAYQANLDGLIDQLAQSGEDDADLYIVDNDGNVVFSSDTASVGSRISPRWLAPANQASDTWLANTPSETVAGAKVTTAIATDAGSVVAVAPRANLAIDVLASMRTAIIAALAFLVLAGALAAVGAALATRTLQARLALLAERYRRAAASVRAGQPPDETPPFTPCLETVSAVMSALDQLEQRGQDADHVTAPASQAATSDEVTA